LFCYNASIKSSITSLSIYSIHIYIFVVHKLTSIHFKIFCQICQNKWFRQMHQCSVQISNLLLQKAHKIDNCISHCWRRIWSLVYTIKNYNYIPKHDFGFNSMTCCNPVRTNVFTRDNLFSLNPIYMTEHFWSTYNQAA